MTLAEQKCPKCNSELVWEYDTYDISEREIKCFQCGWRPVVIITPPTRFERHDYHQRANDKKLAKIKRELAGRRR